MVDGQGAMVDGLSGPWSMVGDLFDDGRRSPSSPCETIMIDL
jgi:hypothetical protein